jgi:hypothetical protein
VPAVAAPALKAGDPNTFSFSDGRTISVAGGQGASQPPSSIAPGQLSPGAISGPALVGGARVPSTFGQSVLSMPDDNLPAIARPTLTLNAQGNADAYRLQEDRQARQRAASDLDSQRFRQELVQAHGGRDGRAATAALSEIGRQQAGLGSGAEALSARDVQNQATRDHQAAVADLAQQGEDRRAQLAANAAAASNATENRRIDVAAIERPSLITDRDGAYLRVTGSAASPILDPTGRAVFGEASKPAGEITPALQFKAVSDEIATLLDNPPPMGDAAAAATHSARLQQLGALRASLMRVQKPSDTP